jgi:uncharacterized membrane protein
MDTNKIMAKALAGAIALGLSAAATQALAATTEMEKCYGVVKAGQNDCGTSQHACAGQATLDGDGSEWVFLPVGTCNKLMGGSTTPDTGQEDDA